MTNVSLLSRRQWLLQTGALAGLALCPALRASPVATARTPWVPALQLYTLGDAVANDLDGTLNELAAIGFRAAELAGGYGRTATELRRAFDRAGLVCPSAHVVALQRPGGWDLHGDLTQLIADLRTVGASYAVLAAPLAPRTTSFDADDWLRTADLLNEKGAILARAGLRIGYHNHAAEFARLPGGKSGYELLLANTDPHLVDFELDVGWATSAGQDLESLFRAANGRIQLLHLKDTQRVAGSTSPLVSSNVGAGIVNWTSLVPLILRANVKHAFVEQEPPFPGPPMESVRAAYHYLSAAFADAATSPP